MREWFELAGLVLKVSIILQVFAIGLGTTWHDATYLFRQPRLLSHSSHGSGSALYEMAAAGSYLRTATDCLDTTQRYLYLRLY